MKKIGFIMALVLLLQVVVFHPSLARTEQSLQPHLTGEAANGPSSFLEKLTVEADVILVAHVVNVSSFWNTGSTTILSDVTFYVENVIKGSSPLQAVTVVVEGGRVGELQMSISGFPTFQKDLRAILFLKHLKDNSYSIVGRQNGVYPLDEDMVDANTSLSDFLTKIAQIMQVSGIALVSPTPPSATSIPGTSSNQPQSGLTASAALYPEITSIVKPSGSAGTNTQIILNGRNFGSIKGAGQITFYFKSGQPRIVAPTVFWSNTSIVATVPVGTINGYDASASSGQVIVTTSVGDSNPFQFAVTFSYEGQKWTRNHPQIYFYVNPGSNGVNGADIAIQNAAQTWSNLQGVNFGFTDYGLTSASSPAFNGVNEIIWGDLGPSGPLANTSSWFDTSGNMVEFDIELNSNDSWSTNGTAGTYDIQSVVTHELGHALGLRDLYGDVGSPNDTQKVMYGRTAAGQIKRSLTQDEIAGISWIYPALTDIKVGGGGFGPFAVAANSVNNRIYVANTRSNNISVIDGSNNLVLATVDVGSGPQGIAVNPITNRIYVANSFGNTVSVIDGISNLLIGAIKVGNNPFRLAVNPDNNRIYVVNYGSNTVSVIDGNTNTVISTVGVGNNPSGIGINLVSNLIYASNDGSNSVSVIDGNSNIVVNSINIGTGPGSIAVNQAGNRIYVVNYDSNSISVINTGNNTVAATVNVGQSPRGIAFDMVNNRVYVTNSAENDLSVIDATSNNVTATVNVGNEPDSVCILPATGRLYVANYLGNTVSVIATDSLSLVGTLSTGCGPDSIRFNPTNNRVYALNSASNSLTIIDVNNPTQSISKVVGNSPSGLAINAATNRIYVANSGNNTLMVFDGVSNNLTASINVGNRPAEVAVNPLTNRVYVCNNGEGSVSVIDGNSNSIVTTIGVGTLPLGIAVNPITNRVYVANNYGNTVSVIDGGNNTVIATITVGTWPFDIDVNPVTNRIYVSNNGSNNISVIDGSTNAVVTKMAVGTGPRGITVNSTNNRVYVVNNGSNTVSLINGINNIVIATQNMPKGPREATLISGTNQFLVTAYWADAIAAAQDLNITPGPATTLAFTVQPAASNLTGKELITQPVVTLLDSNGEVATSSSASISLNITTGIGTPGAALIGVNSINAIFGTATFNGLSINQEGTYTLTATSNETSTTATSNIFSVTISQSATVNLSIVLQGGSRPDASWVVPMTIKLFVSSNTTPLDILNTTPAYSFNITTTKGLGVATANVTGIPPGIYDITAVSQHTLLNVKRQVMITSDMAIGLGTLLEGNANDNNIINIQDFGILAATYGKSSGTSGFDARADFDRNGIINIYDFGLLASNYGKHSPVEIP